jgi:molecular chaperone IbpA
MYPTPDGKDWRPKDWETPRPKLPASMPPTLSTLFPNINRWAIGFDPLFETLKEISKEVKTTTYPPYNLYKQGETYTLELAVAGFTKEDLQLTVKENILTVSGEKTSEPEAAVYRGIAARDFEQDFVLQEYVKIKSAELKDGMLRITLEQELPEDKKAKSIQIK